MKTPFFFPHHSSALLLALISISAPLAASPPATSPPSSPSAPAHPPTISPSHTPAPADEPSGVAQIQIEAKALEPFAKSEEAKRFLRAAADLPTIAPRTLYFSSRTGPFYTESEFKSLPESERASLKPNELSEQFYYTTRYGTPLAYTRPLDIIFSNSSGASPALTTVENKRILDFGFGGIGHLRLLASLGAQAVGVEVDPMLRALYSDPADTGAIPLSSAARPNTRPGDIFLAFGHYPAEDGVTNEVGDGFDLVISKNVLKHGYIHPERPVDKRMLVDLGVDDPAFVDNLFHILKPGGIAMIYNICPAPSPPDKPYRPWTDGRCPFDRALFEKAGFKVLEFDKDDSAATREMAKLLGWDKASQPMDLENDLFAHYTLVQKPMH